MKLEEYLKNETIEIEHCPKRSNCPMGYLCGTNGSQETGKKLFPTILEVERGERLWTDMRFEQRVFVIKDGLFVCLGNDAEGREIPLAVYGKNTGMGLAEIHAPREISAMYHIHCLSSGSVCAFSTNSVRKVMESLDPVYQSAIMACNLTNQSAAMFSQMKIFARQSFTDRVLLLLLRLYDANEPKPSNRSLKITHTEIATLIGADRVTATRVLHKVRDEGYIELGYSTITITDKLLERLDLIEDATVQLCTVKNPNGHKGSYMLAKK